MSGDQVGDGEEGTSAGESVEVQHYRYRFRTADGRELTSSIASVRVPRGTLERERLATTLSGVFTSGGQPMPGARFLLHRDSPDGDLVTPDTFPADRSDNQFVGGAWVAGADGSYSFAGMPEGRYFVGVVELEGGEAPPEAADVPEAEGDDEEGGPEGVIFVQLFGDDGVQALEQTDYVLEIGGVTLRGRTDPDGLLRHPNMPTGHFLVRAAGGTGTVPSLPAEAAGRPFAVLVRGASVRRES